MGKVIKSLGNAPVVADFSEQSPEYVLDTESEYLNQYPVSDVPEPPERMQEQTEKPRNKFAFSGGRDLFKPTPIKWLIRGIAEADSTVSMYGASGCGKSFTAIDMCLSVATGLQWHGHSTKKGKVIFVAGEGQQGIKRRVSAWTQNNNAYDDVAENFLLSNMACLLPDDTNEFIEAMREVPDLKLLVLDTLQRTFSGDENSTRDMTAYIQAADKIRNAIPDLVIMIVHHTGHSANDRARGSSVLRASLDTEIKVENKGGVVILSNTKAKDSETFNDIAFKLKNEPLLEWFDDEGSQMSSAILEHLPEYTEPSEKVLKGKVQIAAKTILNTLVNDRRDELEKGGSIVSNPTITINDWIAACKKSAEINPRMLARSAFIKRVIEPLQEKEVIDRADELIKLVVVLERS